VKTVNIPHFHLGYGAAAAAKLEGGRRRRAEEGGEYLAYKLSAPGASLSAAKWLKN